MDYFLMQLLHMSYHIHIYHVKKLHGITCGSLAEHFATMTSKRGQNAKVKKKSNIMTSNCLLATSTTLQKKKIMLLVGDKAHDASVWTQSKKCYELKILDVHLLAIVSTSFCLLEL